MWAIVRYESPDGPPLLNPDGSVYGDDLSDLSAVAAELYAGAPLLGDGTYGAPSLLATLNVLTGTTGSQKEQVESPGFAALVADGSPGSVAVASLDPRAFDL